MIIVMVAWVELHVLGVLFAGKLCIEVSSASKIAFISEELCIGCGICVKVRQRSLPIWLSARSKICIGVRFSFLLVERFELMERLVYEGTLI